MNGGIGDIFWIFLMISMLQPWLRQKMLDSARVRLMHRIERQRGSRVILLVHRQETMSFLGFPVCATSTSTTPRRSSAPST